MNPLRSAVVRFLNGIEYGSIELAEGGWRHTLGAGNEGPVAKVVVHSPKLWQRMLRGSTGMAESYMLGEWDCDDLVTLTTIAGHNLDRLDGVRERFTG